MKKRRKGYTVLGIMCCLLAVICCPAARAADPPASRADALKALGLFAGTESGYELERTATRAEGLAMLVRLLGAEKEAQSHPADHGFSDVPEWAGGYVAYGVEKGLTAGVGDGRFGSQNTITADQYSAFVLRALGYDEGAGDFVWSSAAQTLYTKRLINAAQLSKWQGGSFRRCDMVDLSYEALCASGKGARGTLSQSLAVSGVFSEEAAKRAGVWPGAEKLPLCTESELDLTSMGADPANLAPSSSGGSYSPGRLAYDEENIYFLHDDGIYRTSMLGGSAELLVPADRLGCDPAAENYYDIFGNLNLYQDSLYLTANGIWRYDLISGEAVKLSANDADSMIVTDGKILYLHGWDCELRSMNTDGSDDTFLRTLIPLAYDEEGNIMLHDMIETHIAMAESGIYQASADSGIPDSYAVTRTPFAGGGASVIAPARSEPAGGGFSPEPGTAVWRSGFPVPSGGWIYYTEDIEQRVLLSGGEKWIFNRNLGNICRVRPDGSGREVLFENQGSRPGPQNPPSRFQVAFDGYMAYTVRDGILFLDEGDGLLCADEYSEPEVNALHKIENGVLTTLYTAPAATLSSASDITKLAVAPGWIFFTQTDRVWHNVEDGWLAAEIQGNAVFRMRPDGSELTRLTD